MRKNYIYKGVRNISYVTVSSCFWVRLTLLSALMAISAVGVAMESFKHRVERPTERLALVELRLSEGIFLGVHKDEQGKRLPPKMDIDLHLYRRGDRFTSGWAMLSSLARHGRKFRKGDNMKNQPIRLDVSGLRTEGDRVHGAVTRWHISNSRPVDAETWTIDARIKDTQVTGSYDAVRPEILGWRNAGKETMSLSGSVTGKLMQGSDLERFREANSLAPGADWPCLTGPHSNGRAVPYAGELVEQWEDARIVWQAEFNMIPGSPGKHGQSGHAVPIFDYESPYVADGKVYFFTQEPVADSPLQDRPGKRGKPRYSVQVKAETQGERQYAWIAPMLVNDVGYCFEASTGALLWRSILGRGANGSMILKGKGGHWSAPVIKDGHVYWCGSNTRVYCLNADTGELVWERVLVPAVVKEFDTKVKAILDAGKTSVGTLPLGPDLHSHVQCSPCIAGGILVCPTKKFGKKVSAGLYGLDAQTGAVKWGPIPAPENYNSPVCWRVDGKEYVLTAGVRCIDPANGEVLWQWNRAPAEKYNGAISKDGLYMTRRSDGKNSSTIGTKTGPILKISPDAAKLVGGIPNYKGRSPPICISCGVTIDDDNNWVYRVPGGVAICDPTGKQQLAFPEKTGIARAGSYGSLIFSNDRIIAPLGENGTGPWMWTWDAESKKLGEAKNLEVSQYICTMNAMADGRLFFRTVGGLVCYDLRKLP